MNPMKLLNAIESNAVLEYELVDLMKEKIKYSDEIIQKLAELEDLCKMSKKDLLPEK